MVGIGWVCGFSHFYSHKKQVEQKSPAKVGYNRQRERKTKQASYRMRVLGHGLWSFLARILEGGGRVHSGDIGMPSVKFGVSTFLGSCVVESTIETFLT